MRTSFLSAALSPLLLLGLSSTALLSCSDTDDEPGTTMGTNTNPQGNTGGHGNHGGGHGDHPAGGCMGAAPFAPNGVVTASSTHRLTVINSEPVIPLTNSQDTTWILKLETVANEAVSGATFTKFSPQMPHHGHGVANEGAITVVADPSLGPGIYRANRLTFNMAGYWKTEVQIELKNPDGTTTALAPLFLETCLGSP